MATPIETTYKGYRMRSRTEARWAVFFHSACEPWAYELEGFDVGGTYYLPDFWLHRIGCWVEVKGSLESADNDSEALCRALADVTELPVLLLYGQPEKDYEAALFAWRYDINVPVPHKFEAKWYISTNGRLAIATKEDGVVAANKRRFAFISSVSRARAVKGSGEMVLKFCDDAKAARFEHGESGTPWVRFFRLPVTV